VPELKGRRLYRLRTCDRQGERERDGEFSTKVHHGTEKRSVERERDGEMRCQENWRQESSRLQYNYSSTEYRGSKNKTMLFISIIGLLWALVLSVSVYKTVRPNLCLSLSFLASLSADPAFCFYLQWKEKIGRREPEAKIRI
jgi:hypothetical protein